MAIAYLIKAYEGFDVLNSTSKKASVCNTIASIQRLLGNLEISKQYYLTSLSLRKQLKDSVKLAYGYNNLANILNTQKKYDSAIAYYYKAIVIQEELDNKKELGKYYYNLGTIYFLQKKFNKAAVNYKKSISIKKLNNDNFSLANPYNELAAISIKKKDFISAKDLLDTAKTYLSIRQNKDVLLRHYDLQSKFYQEINDFKKALKYKEQHNTLYKTLFKQKQTKVIQELQERFESKQKSEKIQNLVNGDKIQKAVISNQVKDLKQKNFIIIVCIILLLLITTVYFYYKEKQKLKEKNLELFRLKSIFKSQEIIKEKISKDLHDIVTTRYDGIRLKIEALPNVKNPNIVGKKIVLEIAEINEEIRLISHRISPLGNKIKNTPLTKIIEDQCVEFHYYRKIFVDINLPLPEELNSFHIEAQTNFYGILLEALNNIEKHSKASDIVISHKKTSNSILFEISDNGIGYKQTYKKGIGVLYMNQRTQLLGGDFSILGTEAGTKITIKFPIKLNKL